VAGCAPPAVQAPQVIEKEVPVTVVVEKVVEVEKEVPVEVTRVVEVPAAAPAAAGPVTLTLYDPTGAIEVSQLFSARLDTLEGKTICEVSNRSWQADRTFALIRELLQKQFPTAKFITYDQFPSGTAAITDEKTKIGELLQAAGCQAAITGNAG